MKNVGLFKPFNNKELFPSQYTTQVKQEENIHTIVKLEDASSFSHMLDPYRGDSMLGVSLNPTHLSHPMYSNIVPDMQHVPVQPIQFITSQSALPPSQLETSTSEQDYIIEEIDPQTLAPPKKTKSRGKSKDRPFECEICFRRFNQKQTLKQHVLTHTGQRPFECNQCFKTFTQQGALQRHVVIHTGEKPFPCGICDLSFRQKINLLRHMKLHTGAPKEFQCNLCLREFSRKGALLRHEQIHATERPRLQCSCCNKEFLNKESLIRHEKNQELREKGISIVKRRSSKRNGKVEKIIINCAQCGKVFRRSKSNLSVTSDSLTSSCVQCCQSHVLPSDGILREVEIFQCGICQAIFHKSASYEKHKLLHSNARKYECDICHLRFKEKRFVRNHMVTHFNVCEHQCHMCGLNFKYASKLKAHYVIHASEFGDDLENYVRVFTCYYCDRVHYQRNQIIRHLKKHESHVKNPTSEVDNDSCDDVFSIAGDDYNDSDTNTKPSAITDLSEPPEDRGKTHPFFCYICKRSYTKKRSLNRHFQVAHTNYEKFACEICSKTFQTKNSLKAHYVLHKPHSFQCNQCEKTFNRKDALASHKLIHSEKKSFLCPYCPKSFFQKQSLHTHLIQHKGDRSFECGVCGKSFYERSTLNRHYLSHSGERKYSCHICNMSFIQKNHLDKHFLRHDEIEKKVTFPCEDCEKIFYRKDHYLRHRQSHEDNRTLYPCSLCDRKFTDKYSLARHVKYKKCEEKKPRGRRKMKQEPEEEEET